jgi:hypothetical protein
MGEAKKKRPAHEVITSHIERLMRRGIKERLVNIGDQVGLLQVILDEMVISVKHREEIVSRLHALVQECEEHRCAAWLVNNLRRFATKLLEESKAEA